MSPNRLFDHEDFRTRHYVLKAPFNTRGQRYVVPVRNRIRDYSACYGDAFALAIWVKRSEHFEDTYVIPFGLIASGFRAPRDRPQDDGWTVAVRKDQCYIGVEKTGVEVKQCRGDQELVQELLRERSKPRILELLAQLKAPRDVAPHRSRDDATILELLEILGTLDAVTAEARMIKRQKARAKASQT